MIRCTLIAGLLILANCSESKEAGEATSQEAGYAPAPLPEPVSGAASTWTAGAIGGEAAAVFVSAAREPLFSILCGGEGSIVLQRHFETAPRPGARMELTVGREARALEAGIEGASPKIFRTVLPSQDGFIANIARMNAPAVVTAAGAPTLVLPPNPMIGEFIRDCQRRMQAA